MGVRRRARAGRRLATVTALALAVLLVALLLLGGSSYHIRLTLDNASQLVKGNLVKVGGVPVGSVDSITLGDDARARIDISIDDRGLTPLHDGTRAEVRSTGLAGVANRYVSLEPGPNNAASIPDGGSIPATASLAEVDLDQLLNTLDPATLRDLQQFVTGSAASLSRRGQQFGRALVMLDPALVQADRVERQVLDDQASFTRFLVESAGVVSAVATRRADLTQLVSSAATTMAAIAGQDAALDSSLRRFPPTLRLTNTTLVNLRNTLRDADPTIRAARPVAAPLAAFLDRLAPVAVQARPVVRELRLTVDAPGSADLLGVLQGFPRLERVGSPAFASAVRTVRDLLPIVNQIRPYTPDLVAGITNGLGGTTSGYYDANGHFTRISAQGSVFSTTGLGSLIPTPPALPGLTGYRSGITHRCPGDAAQPAPDRSNPILLGEAICHAGDTPP